MKRLIRTLVLLSIAAFSLSSCSDTPDLGATVVIRGKAMTGARTRTPVSGGYVELIFPKTTWTQMQFATDSEVPNKAVTNTDGSYTFTITVSALETYDKRSFFIAVSDKSQTFTMMAEIPADAALDGGEITVDINPTTTAAALMVCPGGKYPPPSGAYCYEDTGSTTATIASEQAAIDASLAGTNASLEATATFDWSTFMSTLLNDTTLLNKLKDLFSAAGYSTSTGFTKAAISSAITALPKVTKPIPTDANVPSSEEEDTSDSAGCVCDNGKSCTKHSDCGVDSNGIPNVCGCPVGYSLFKGGF